MTSGRSGSFSTSAAMSARSGRPIRIACGGSRLSRAPSVFCTSTSIASL